MLCIWYELVFCCDSALVRCCESFVANETSPVSDMITRGKLPLVLKTIYMPSPFSLLTNTFLVSPKIIRNSTYRPWLQKHYLRIPLKLSLTLWVSVAILVVLISHETSQPKSLPTPKRLDKSNGRPPLFLQDKSKLVNLTLLCMQPLFIVYSVGGGCTQQGATCCGSANANNSTCH